MMRCAEAGPKLNTLVDGEKLSPRATLNTLAHVAGCGRCRRSWSSLRRLRGSCRALSQIPSEVPAGLCAQVRAGIADSPVPFAQSTVGRKHRRLLGGVALGLGVVAAVGMWIRGSRQALAAEVGSAIDRVGTWRLIGWKDGEQGRVKWEIWGRRQPYLYYEAQGGQRLVDDGTTRLQVVIQSSGQALAVRMASRRDPESAPWTQLTLGDSWPRKKAWRLEGDRAIFREPAYGMEGPGSQSAAYYFVDQRTHLPLRYEYRQVRGGKEVVTEALSAEYDRPAPATATSTAPPEGAQLVEASGGPELPVSAINVSHSGEVTGQILPVKVAPDGTVLARLRTWFGGAPLEAEGGNLFSSFSLPYSFITVDGSHHPWPIVDDRGRPYVVVEQLQNGGSREGLLNGAHMLWLAPLEPLRQDDPLPTELHLGLDIHTGVWGHGHGTWLTREDMRWTVPLPGKTSRISPEDYMTPPAQQRTFYRERLSPVEQTCEQRARMYGCQSDFAASARWRRYAIALLPATSDYGQYLRGSLAADYSYLHDRAREKKTFEEIIAVHERYPQTWEYYARSAQQSLKFVERSR
jgi:hypothetical protein